MSQRKRGRGGEVRRNAEWKSDDGRLGGEGRRVMIPCAAPDLILHKWSGFHDNLRTMEYNESHSLPPKGHEV